MIEIRLLALVGLIVTAVVSVGVVLVAAAFVGWARRLGRPAPGRPMRAVGKPAPVVKGTRAA